MIPGPKPWTCAAAGSKLRGKVPLGATAGSAGLSRSSFRGSA